MSLPEGKINPWIYCKDGQKISIQAGRRSCSTPRRDWKNHPSEEYTHFELSYSGKHFRMLRDKGYGGWDGWPDVFTQVPRRIVLELLERHGGIETGCLPEMEERNPEEALLPQPKDSV